ncbi:MAG: dipeptidase PepE [Burkholderiales bacterium]|nr:dipeptidase PepE [Burkholderiales bacterium]
MELLLLSNSMSDAGYLTHARSAIAEIAAGIGEGLFLPYAGVTRTWDAYEALVADALAPIGLRVHSLHRAADPARAAAEAPLVLAGGGNTFALLHHCRRTGVLEALRSRERAGLRFVGWSAGANLACPTIRTTNDMPIIDPGGFDALGLVSFQLNPHYTNAHPSGHRGETRDERLAEFLKVNPEVGVLALPEGDWLRVSRDAIVLGGAHQAKWMRHGREPVALKQGPLQLP